MDFVLRLEGSKVAVVGLGYLGAHLLRYLQAIQATVKFEVKGFTRHTLESIAGAEFDYVFNCAGTSGDFRTRVWDTIDSNISTTKYLLNNVRIKKAYVNTSSTRIYGFSNDPQVCFGEDDVSLRGVEPLGLDFIYDGTKMLVESILRGMENYSNYKLITCRLSNVFGRYVLSDLNDSTFLKVMIRHSVERRPLNLLQNGLSTKGYIFIDDALLGLLRCAVLSEKSETYNICSGTSYSIQDWISYLNLNVTSASVAAANYARNSIKKAAANVGFAPEHFLNNTNFNLIYSYDSK